MPPHTGTGTASAYFMQPEQIARLNVTQCVQTHETCTPPDAKIVAMFVANPFRRVLSDAAYRGVINGSRRSYQRESEETARLRFVHWVRSLHYVSPGIVGCCAHGQRMPLQSQFTSAFSCAVGGCRLWLGRTAALGADMGQLLRDLGYSHHGEVRFASTHCGASCPAAGGFVDFQGRSTAGGGYHNATFAEVSARTTELLKSVTWFDANATRTVTTLFAADFDAYGFSRDPANMWKLPTTLHPGFMEHTTLVQNHSHKGAHGTLMRTRNGAATRRP